jgi:chitin disaccharide deacetylase
MAGPRSASLRRLIVNADDFGRSHSINRAIVQAHREGILTTASLMVNGEAFNEAVEIARQNPRLGVGLHLTLLCGTSALPQQSIPGLVNSKKEFSNNPAATGMRYFFHRGLKKQLEAEITAQFEKFQSTGLSLDHVNGHLHIHLHPTVFKILMQNAEKWNIRHFRLTRDDFWLSARTVRGQWLYRVTHAIIYRALSTWARPVLRQKGISHTQLVFGLLQNSRVDAPYVAQLLPQLPPGDSELYSHPSLDQFKNELDALICPDNKKLAQKLGIDLIRYQDL